MWTFRPIYKPTIWGGGRIATFKSVEGLPERIGECWEISDLEGMQTVVESGIDAGKTLSQLVAEKGSDLLGERNHLKYGDRFPLLVKFIDACDDLSVQVHPSDSDAEMLGVGHGKNEMWYVVDSSRGSRIASGFKPDMCPEYFDQLVISGQIEAHLNFVDVAPGDTFYIPAGTVHAVGAGCLILEIQQSSDVTFRVYDYNRKDRDGKCRDLHTEFARRSLDFGSTGQKVCYQPRPDVPVTLVNTPFFNVNLLNLDEETIRDYSEWDTFVILTATRGIATVRCRRQSVVLDQGNSVLIPASADNVTIEPRGAFTAVETYIK